MSDDATLPPDSREAEKQVIGSILLLPEVLADVKKILRPFDFRTRANRIVYDAILELDSGQFPIETPALLDKLRGSTEFTTDGPGVYLYEITTAVATAANAEHYARMMVVARCKLQLLGIGEDIVEAASNCKAPEEIFRVARAALDDYGKETTSDKPSFRAISAAEFDTSTYEQHFLIDGALAEFAPTIAAAARKGMKTSVLMDYSIAQAAGGHFLGYFPTCGKRRVLFCSGESGLPTLQETARRICRKAGHELGRLENLLVSTDLPNVGSGDSLEDFRQFIADEGAEVVIVDPAYLCFPSVDAGNLFAAGERLAALNGIIAEQNATLILVHHTKKLIADPFGQPELENIAWSGFQEYARQWWLLGRREVYEPGSGIHRLWFNVGGSAGHGNLFAVDINEGRRDDPGGRQWAVTVAKASEAKHAAQQRKSEAKAEMAAEQLEIDRTAVCRVLAKHPSGTTKTAVREACGVSSRRFPTVFASMVDAGELVACEVTVSNHKTPRQGFKLGDSEVS